MYDVRYWPPASDAYCAGLFDGEGSITITNTHRQISRGKNYIQGCALHVRISNKNRKILAGLKDCFGGSLYLHKKTGVSDWIVEANYAKNFLEHVLPYLKIKFLPAWIAYCFQSYRRKAHAKDPITPREREAHFAAREVIMKINGRHA